MLAPAHMPALVMEGRLVPSVMDPARASIIWHDHLSSDHLDDALLCTQHVYGELQQRFMASRSRVCRCPQQPCVVRCTSIQYMLAHLAQYHFQGLADFPFRCVVWGGGRGLALEGGQGGPGEKRGE